MCIGCGLCESIAGSANVQLILNDAGRERPVTQTALSDATVETVYAACPGVNVNGLEPERFSKNDALDQVWGHYAGMWRGFAGNPDVRHRGSTGGVLSALGMYLLESKQVDFVLHVSADPDNPLRNIHTISNTPEEVLNAAGSRYGPAAPLRDFINILERKQPFAFIAKPCDINAVRNLAKTDPRVDEYCKFLLTLVCGGASEMTKSWGLLDEWGITEDDLSLFRYRGYGNPGLTVGETKDGRHFEVTYLDLWEDEAKWNIQTRCKVCPDAIGEQADIAASDVWPGGGPTGEDAGWNGIIPRTQVGIDLLNAAIRDGAIVIDKELTPRDMDVFQPHQVRKKKAVWQRLKALRSTGHPALNTSGLRLEALSQTNDVTQNAKEYGGTIERVKVGKFAE